MKKSSVQTFESLRLNLKTQKEYQHPSSYKYTPHFKAQTTVLAHHLMSLWTSKPAEDDYHYVRVVHQGRFYHQGILHENILELPIQNIRLSFRHKDPMHLGKMTLFHLIFAIHHDPKHLVMIQKPNENTFYFSLKTRKFWSDYFHPDHAGVHFFSDHPAEDKVKLLIDTQHPWWQSCLSGSNLRKIFLKEFFEIYFRIYLTPWAVIETLALQIMGYEHPDFLEYLKIKFETLHERFSDFLTEEEQTAWENFIRYDGHQHLEQYLKDFEEFANWLEFLSPQRKQIMKAGMIEKALLINIFRIENFCQPAYIPLFSFQTQHRYLSYILNLCKNQWQAFLQDPKHHYWTLLDKACAGISTLNPHIQVHENDDNKQILCKAVQFNQNNIARFFILKNRRLGDSINQYDVPTSPHFQRSLFFSALILENIIVIKTLKECSISLRTEDRVALRAYLLHCVDAHLADTFVFILKNQYEILYHLNEEHILFREILENYCQTKNKAFLMLIPKENLRPLSFFNSSSSSSSESSSDVDSPLTAYKKINSLQEEDENNDEDDFPFMMQFRK